MQQRTPKQAVLHFLDGLPEDVTFDDIHYGVYVLWKIDQGLHDAESGQTVPREEAKAWIAMRFGHASGAGG